ncbi:multidrug effflux MFS transporter [Tranquillimonas alkanivorans]|uniref:Bcr/CflA family efflux transporter n=1 Tax=Tranquillimonas alkanivorans TaxID=441119 RepID=A0A1I5N5P4_9RHOB|nr:multidrug effflux MFS transporter [Tranquillimonas alkanivorans]SFP16912.1 MFS transporter, DHA1 family, bicyclomycin/chloramphenicol resistance protein [Tranquillimonas alkanivorans]
MSDAKTVRFLDRTTPPHIGTLILLAGISALSMNVFLPSLPNMTAYFDTEYRIMQLSVALYLAVNGALQILIGPLSDRYGRRPVMLTAIALFVVASIGCIFSPTVEIFLGFRMAQAVIITGMVLSRAVVRDMVPQEQAASMIGYVTMGTAVAPMLAPALGGVLDGIFGWQASFWLLAILGCVTLWITHRDLGETAAAQSASFREQIAEYPELLTSRRFWGYCAAAALCSGAFFAYLGGAPYVGSVVFEMEPATLGVFFGAPAVGYMVGNFVSGRYSVRVGINGMVLTGTVLTTSGMAMALLLFLAGFQSHWVFFGFMTFVGLGNGMVLPNATSGMLSVRPHLAGTASGLGGAMMIGGGAALSAVAGALLTPGSGATPLLWLMVTTSALALLSILYTIRRERVVVG